MEVKDYAKEKALLGQLELLKKLKQLQSDTDTSATLARRFVENAYEGSLGPRAQEHVQSLVDKFNNKERVIDVLTSTLDLLLPVEEELKEEVKNIKTSISQTQDNIGSMMKEVMEDKGYEEDVLMFPSFGNIKCTLKKTLVIQDEEAFKQYLLDNDWTDLLKVQTVPAIMKTIKNIENLDGADGVEVSDVPTVKVTLVSTKG